LGEKKGAVKASSCEKTSALVRYRQEEREKNAAIARNRWATQKKETAKGR